MTGRRRRGQVLVEFAVGLPLLIGFLFFLIESGYYLTAKQGIHTALREGAVLAATRAQNGQLADSERPILVEAMRLAFKRPGITNSNATVKIKAGNKGCLVTLSVEGAYKGITPIAQAFQGLPIGGTLIVPLGQGGAK